MCGKFQTCTTPRFRLPEKYSEGISALTSGRAIALPLMNDVLRAFTY